MFQKARLKLTAWYLLIIMFVSIAFSLVIYRGLMSEMYRFSRMQRLRVERLLPPNPAQPFFIDEDLIIEIKQRVIFGLGIINTIIFITSGALGYFLAGKTLRPIQEMVYEQNRFISDASHELRTPLTSLKTAIEVGLRDKKLNLAGAKKLINDNLFEINKLQSLSEGLLQLAQYKIGNNNFKLEKLSLRKIVDEAVKKIEIIAREKKIIIKKNIKDYKVQGNEYSLTDLIVILLDNAIKYSKTNSEVVIDSKTNNKTVLISVKDRGIGIDEKDLPHVFDRFYRAETVRSHKGSGGYGLGLSIAKKIIEAHQGEIKVESKLGKGTNVIVSLPVFS